MIRYFSDKERLLINRRCIHLSISQSMFTVTLADVNQVKVLDICQAVNLSFLSSSQSPKLVRARARDTCIVVGR